MDEILILVKRTADEGGYRAAIYQSGYGAKQKQAFGSTPKQALENLIENFINSPLQNIE